MFWRGPVLNELMDVLFMCNGGFVCYRGREPEVMSDICCFYTFGCYILMKFLGEIGIPSESGSLRFHVIPGSREWSLAVLIDIIHTM